MRDGLHSSKIRHTHESKEISIARTSHWHRRYFTATPVADSIHFAPSFFILRNLPPANGWSAGTSMKPKRTILCVDDNEQSLSHRKIMLETRGYKVAGCSSGDAALERFKQGGIDLVITDLGMPGLDGTKLVATIKALSPQTPAVLISSRTRLYSHDSQADVFLAKGMYTPAELLERVRLLLVRKRGPKRSQRPLPEAALSQTGVA